MKQRYQANEFVHSKPMETAAELWEALSPVHIPAANEYIYRGQADANWSLIPLLLRSPLHSGSINWEKALLHEYAQLKQFATFCDSAGIELPAGVTLPENNSNNPLSFFGMVAPHAEASLWPNEKLLPLMAMAQHHGVATRLLDWTRNPYTAAYFAASSALSRHSEDGFKDSFLAVWVLNRTAFLPYKIAEIHEEAAHWSPHISAQSGLFSVSRTTGGRSKTTFFQPLDEAVNTIHIKHKLIGSIMTRYTLPVTEAPQLLDLCEKVNINAATIYRSADGAGKAVGDQNNKISAMNLFNDSQS